MTETVIKRRQCVHCGVGLIRQHTGSWCRMCQNESRRNKGICSFCDHDIADWSACWDIRRQLDSAIVKTAFPDWMCPSCFEHSNERNTMEIIRLESTEVFRSAVLVCAVCQTTLRQRYELYKPPPAGRT